MTPPSSVKGPQVDAELVGVFPTVGQTIEDRYGKPIECDTDINGKGVCIGQSPARSRTLRRGSTRLSGQAGQAVTGSPSRVQPQGAHHDPCQCEEE